MPSRTTNTISSTHPASSNRRQVCATIGQPPSSRKSLSILGPIRVPLPAATIMAETIKRREVAVLDWEFQARRGLCRGLLPLLARSHHLTGARGVSKLHAMKWHRASGLHNRSSHSKPTPIPNKLVNDDLANEMPEGRRL